MRRGYVILAILLGVIYWAGIAGMHWSFKMTTVVAAGGVIALIGLQMMRYGFTNKRK